MVRLISCGLNHGAPPAASLVIDCRDLPDPSGVVLGMPGIDPEVGAVIVGLNPLAVSSVELAGQLVLEKAAADPDVVVVFCCNAGMHRSAFVAEEVAALVEEAGVEACVIHRDLGMEDL